MNEPRQENPLEASSTIAWRENAPRVMFLTIGKAPREDIVPAIAAQIDLPIDVHQMGILNDLSRRHIDELTAVDGEPMLVTYLSRNIRICLSRAGVVARLNAILAGFRPYQYDLVVVMVAGFSDQIVAKGPILNAHRAMESALLSVLPADRKVGIIHPLASQVSHQTANFSSWNSLHASARERNQTELMAALLELGEADLILLPSISYDDEDYCTLTKVTQKPVLLGRRILTGAIRLLLLSGLSAGKASLSENVRERLATLTPRQSEILGLVCAGRTSKQIGQALSISPKTVEVHRGHIMRRLETPSTTALIAMLAGSS
jgi:DNA-binding CsgD family transcriptional regulator